MRKIMSQEPLITLTMHNGKQVVIELHMLG
jgi:hypothetical protein